MVFSISCSLINLPPNEIGIFLLAIFLQSTGYFNVLYPNFWASSTREVIASRPYLFPCDYILV